jgi:hypothetical protein
MKTTTRATPTRIVGRCVCIVAAHVVTASFPLSGLPGSASGNDMRLTACQCIACHHIAKICRRMMIVARHTRTRHRLLLPQLSHQRLRKTSHNVRCCHTVIASALNESSCQCQASSSAGQPDSVCSACSCYLLPLSVNSAKADDGVRDGRSRSLGLPKRSPRPITESIGLSNHYPSR